LFFANCFDIRVDMLLDSNIFVAPLFCQNQSSRWF
jgi:hypothetical protein